MTARINRRVRVATALGACALLAAALLAPAQEQPADQAEVPEAPPPEQRPGLIEQERQRIRSDAPGMDNLLAGLERIEGQEREARRQLEKIDTAIDDVGHEIMFTEADAFLTRNAIGREERDLARRVRSLYVISRGGLAQVLLASEDFNNFLINARLVNRVVERDVARLRRNREHVLRLARARDELGRDREFLDSLKRRAESQRFWVELERQRRLALIDLISSDRTLYSRVATEREQAGLDLAATLERMGRAGAAQSVQSPEGLDFVAMRGRLPAPAPGPLVRAFGRQVHPQFGTVTFSNGVGIGAPQGTPVRAVYPGVVRYSGSFYGYGQMVILDHGGRYHTVYGHLDEVSVSEGETVEQGRVLGSLGRSGSLAGPLLHFEIRHRGKSIDPLEWIDWGSQEEH